MSYYFYKFINFSLNQIYSINVRYQIHSKKEDKNDK